MNPDEIFPTDHASAERTPDDVITGQCKTIYSLPFVKEFLDSVQNMSVVLNKDRQIIFSNQSFVDFLGNREFEGQLERAIQDNYQSLGRIKPFGLRPGEAARCVHATNNTGGCGTTLFCRSCGAVNAILESQTSKKMSIKECRMTCHSGDEVASLDLRIWSRPINIDGNEFTVFSIMDTGDEKRRLVLERIFFHDLLNTAGGMQGLSNILAESELNDPELNEITAMLHESADNLIEEIQGHRTLSEAEAGEAKITPEPLNSLELIDSISRKYSSHNVAKNKFITVNNEAEDCAFVSDHHLTRRVLINLVKNALEASNDGEYVTLNCTERNGAIEFTVHNPAVMPISIQLQIFNRSFSTKGDNRGVGTYSIKLLTTRYLKGRVSFISSNETGTIFKVRLPLELD